MVGGQCGDNSLRYLGRGELRSDYPLGRGLAGFLRKRRLTPGQFDVASLIMGWLHHLRFGCWFTLSRQEPALAEIVLMEALPGLPPALRLELLFDACNLANQFSRWEEMGQYLDRLEALSEELTSREGLARVRFLRASRLASEGEYLRAVGHYQQALSLARETGQEDLEAEILNDIGFCQRRLSDDQAALRHYRESLEIRERNGNLPGQAESLNNIGLALCRCGRFDEAEAALSRALRTGEAVGDRLGIGYTLLNLSHLASRKKDHRLAEELCRRALTVRREIGDQLGLGYCYTNLAFWARERGRKEEALELLEQAEGAFSSAGDSYGQTEARMQRVRYMIEFGMPVQARRELESLEAGQDQELEGRQLERFRELQAALNGPG
jgi:tetratricopeptide (TPR) repeat protein